MPHEATPATPESSADRLLKAALRVFNEIGVNAASIHEICRLADVSIGSAYHHFGSKQGLADALLVNGLSDNNRRLAEQLRRVQGAEAGVRAAVKSVIRWIEDNPELAQFIYMTADSKARDSTGKLLQQVNADYWAMIEDYFKSYVHSGELRRLPLECYAPLILGPVHDYARKYLSGQITVPPSKRADMFADAAWLAVKGNG